MSIEHIDILKRELPELFDDRKLSDDWNEDFNLIQMKDPTSLKELYQFDVEQFGIFDTEEESLESRMPINLGAEENFPSVKGVGILIEDLFKTDLAGSPIAKWEGSGEPPPECFSFYLPYHTDHPDNWGIYITYEGRNYLAEFIRKHTNFKVVKEECEKAAQLFLYHHEAFHHKVEVFSNRLEIPNRKRFYLEGFKNYYQKFKDSDNSWEEALANADALLICRDKLKNPHISDALFEYVRQQPVGYRRGVELLRKDEFIQRRSWLAEEIFTHCEGKSKKDPSIWRTAPHLFDALTNLKNRLVYIIPMGSPLSQRKQLRPSLPPAKLIKKLKKVVGLKFVRHGGRHDIWVTKDGREIPIPRHPGDLGRGLVRDIISQAGLSVGFREFLNI